MLFFASFSIWLGYIASSALAFYTINTRSYTYVQIFAQKSQRSTSLLKYSNDRLDGAIPVVDIERGIEGRIEEAFGISNEKDEAAFVTFITAGYPSAQDTPSLLLAMQEGGASVIELGIPYSDPWADGPIIQHANHVAIARGTSGIKPSLEMVRKAREIGLTVPVVLMGYSNPFHQHDIEKLCIDSKNAGADGFLVVDLLPEERVKLNKACARHGLSNIPIVDPTSSNTRIASCAEMASTFLYCASVKGVTGIRDALPPDLCDFIKRVRSKTDLPLAVGFGISSPEMENGVANMADGVVVGSAIVKALSQMEGREATTEQRAEVIRDVTAHLAAGLKQSDAKNAGQPPNERVTSP